NLSGNAQVFITALAADIANPAVANTFAATQTFSVSATFSAGATFAGATTFNALATFSAGASISRLTGGGVVLTYGPTVSTDASAGNSFVITANNATAFTIANPTNAVDGQHITYTIRNTAGVALGTITWGTAFKMAAFTAPATGNSRSIEFRYDAASTS